MQTTKSLPAVRAIMTAFASRTGLSAPGIPPRRYLWTDAHAVCVLLGLFQESGDEAYRRLATTLIGQVHNVLGKHREDDPREGWISGLSEDEGREHPTAGGLRIGKKLNERGMSDPIDERAEWDRDGQYFHYLTKWMHALCRASAVIGEARYARWAHELARAAYRGFVVEAPGGKRLQWKMSIGLSYPLVASSGHHDPLDAYITYNEVSRSATCGLDDELTELTAMIVGPEWTTMDPLGIGGLLFDACRVLQLAAERQLDGRDLARTLLTASDESLGAYTRTWSNSLSAEHRLAFRELGLSIGLHAVEYMTEIVDRSPRAFGTPITQPLEDLLLYVPIAETVEAFWGQADNQRSHTWREHADINAVTLATSLLPNEFLTV